MKEPGENERSRAEVREDRPGGACWNWHLFFKMHSDLGEGSVGDGINILAYSFQHPITNCSDDTTGITRFI